MKKAANSIMTALSVRESLRALANPAKAAEMARFFKTGPGEYAEGDLFWGLTAPQVRALAKAARELPLDQAERLLEDPVHEARSCALVILVERFKKADAEGQSQIIELYLRRADRINNWDLVDISAAMLGWWLSGRDRSLLYRLAESPNLWEQRMAVVGTLPLIKAGDFTDILALSERLLTHRHDLMHKAVGWMLREVGKKDRSVLEAFLERHAQAMPRTSLRYAIERFPEEERKAWLRY